MDTSSGRAEAEARRAEALPDGVETLPTGALPTEVAGGLERLTGLFRRLSPPSGLSLTAAATLATLERSGPRRLTALAVREGVTQPAMTQLIGRLQEEGLVTRDRDPADRRVVQVSITDEGRARLNGRRAFRAERLVGLLNQLTPEQRVILAAALPVVDVLASASDDDIAGPDRRTC